MRRRVFALSAISIGAVAITSFALLANHKSAAMKVMTLSNEEWGHYLRVDPTFETAGSQEFWISCDTHNILFEAPEDGYVTERGTPTAEKIEEWKDLDDGRYLPAWKIDSTHLQFGEYPQEKVTDESLIAQLTEKLSVTSPSTASHDGWTVFDYYANSNPLSTNFYQDIRLGAYRYRAIMIRGYRPFACNTSSTTGNSQVDDNGYTKDTLYFFKFMPIQWRLLFADGNTYKILSTTIMDSTQFNYTLTDDTTPTGYANHYGESDIREFLNNSFYNLAFNSFEKNKSISMDINNTGPSSPAVDSANTNDKVTILSYAEARSADYGFTTTNDATPTRVFPYSDYAQSQGLMDNHQLLRTASKATTLGQMCYVMEAGAIKTNKITFTRYGIAPIITINIA